LTEPRELSTEQRVEQLGRAAFAVPAPSGGPHEPMPEGGEVQSISSGWRLALSEFASNRLAVAALVVLIAIVLFCFLGPVLYHSNQASSNPLNATLAPGQASPTGGAAHLLGTDESGFAARQRSRSDSFRRPSRS
jgi:predicted permease